MHYRYCEANTYVPLTKCDTHNHWDIQDLRTFSNNLAHPATRVIIIIFNNNNIYLYRANKFSNAPATRIRKTPAVHFLYGRLLGTYRASSPDRNFQSIKLVTHFSSLLTGAFSSSKVATSQEIHRSQIFCYYIWQFRARQLRFKVSVHNI